MFKLFKKFKAKEWLLVLLILGLTFLKVYLTMALTDWISSITKAITYLNYHNNPGLLSPVLEKLINGGITWNDIVDIVNNNASLLTLSKVHDLLTDEEINYFVSMQGSASSFDTSVITSIANATTGDIWFNSGMMMLTALGMVAIEIVIAIIASYVASSVASRVRKELNDTITDYSLAEINAFSTASLITRATNDVQQYQMFLLLMMRMFFSAPITAIWAILKMQSVSFSLIIPIIIGVSLLVIGLIFLLYFVLPKFRLMQKLIDLVNGISGENVKGIRVVKAYNATDYQVKKFEKTNKDLTDTQLFTGRILCALSPLITLIMNGLSLAIYWIGGYLISEPSQNITFARILSFVVLATQVIMAFMMLLLMFIMFPRAEVSCSRINEILKTKASVVDPEIEKERTSKGEIEFDNVSFKYLGGNDYVLKDISFKAKQGETVAIIGATGCGKTTLINLIPRLYDCSLGTIKIDGVDVKELKQKTLRSLIGFVPQRGLLFSGTIKYNVSFGKIDASIEDVKKACQIAEADGYIQEKEKGYDSYISQGGQNVSGGQRQRLCIARALINNPEILVFDDSFSALDLKTDRKVRENLAREEKGVTKVIVAQRIGTIMDADKILVLEDGKVIAIGKHEELLKTCLTYKNIALSQLSKEELGIKEEHNDGK